MHLIADREGNLTKEHSFQDRLLAGLYGHIAGRLLLKPLVLPIVSKLAGCFLDSGASRIFIGPFIRYHSIQMQEYGQEKYRSFNAFFKRKLPEGMRMVQEQDDLLVSPCDSRLSVYKLNSRCTFWVKHTRYTAESILKDHELAETFAGGYVWIFRLCVDDYHRYIYVDDGYASASVHIPGVLHTVNPVSADHFPVYKENAREYCLLYSDHFGTILQMEVGALLVGKIENHPGGRIVKRGKEKGNFAFGGSTVILMTQAGEAVPDKDILESSKKGIETRVKMGEQVGKNKKNRISKNKKNRISS